MDSSTLHPNEPSGLIKLSIFWVGGALLVLFLFAALSGSDFLSAIFFMALLALVGCAGFALLLRGVHLAIHLRGDPKRASTAVISPIMAIVVLGLSLPSTISAAGWVHAFGFLITNKSDYDRDVLLHSRKTSGERNTMLVWNYGGWLSDDQDIVYDPTGHPAKNLVRDAGAGRAYCRPLEGNYFDCNVSY